MRIIQRLELLLLLESCRMDARGEVAAVTRSRSDRGSYRGVSQDDADVVAWAPDLCGACTTDAPRSRSPLRFAGGAGGGTVLVNAAVVVGRHDAEGQQRAGLPRRSRSERRSHGSSDALKLLVNGFSGFSLGGEAEQPDVRFFSSAPIFGSGAGPLHSPQPSPPLSPTQSPQPSPTAQQLSPTVRQQRSALSAKRKSAEDREATYDDDEPRGDADLGAADSAMLSAWARAGSCR